MHRLKVVIGVVFDVVFFGVTGYGSEPLISAKVSKKRRTGNVIRPLPVRYASICGQFR
jgi:hypothetical protein